MEYPSSFQTNVHPTVGVGPRLLASLVDCIVLSILTALLSPMIGPNKIAFLSSVGGVIGLLYYIILEAILGATLGKLICGLRVTKDDGSPIDWLSSLIRNLLRIIDILPVSYLVGAIIIWNNPQKKRLGDIVAHTVVRKKTISISNQ